MMPGPIAILASAGIMFFVIWSICKIFNVKPTSKGDYWNGWISGFIVGQEDGDL